MKIFYNGKCIKAVLEGKVMESKSKGMLIAKYKFDKSICDNLIPEFNTKFTNYEIVDEYLDTEDITTISTETILMFNSDSKPDEHGVLTTEYEVETPVLINAGDIVTRSIYSNELPTKMTFGYDQDTSYSNATIASSLLSVISINCSKLVNGYRMFKDCSNLTSINCNWNQCRLKHHIGMFQNCKSLIDANFESLITSDSINIASIFAGCHSLTEINTNGWDTINVKDMSNAFNTCKSLISLDVSNFNTSKVTDMAGMFKYCYKLTTLDVSNWNTSNVTNMYQMFYYCQLLTSLDVSNFDTSNVTNMNGMFNSCNNLTSLDVSNFDTSKVTNMQGMFFDCRSLTELDLSNWNTNKVTNMNFMFYNCALLSKIIMNNSDYSSVNKIITQLPTRTSDSKGTLNIAGIDNISQVDTTTVQSKYWNIVV